MSSGAGTPRPEAAALQSGFWIGECHVEPKQNRLLRGDAEVRLERRVMDVLVCLAEHAGEVVSRDTISERVWGKVVVTDQALTNCISELRQHLGDDRSARRIIETIPKRGYRLAAQVRLTPQQDAVGPAADVRPATSRRGVIAVGAVLLVAALAVGAWWMRSSSPALTSIAILPFENAAGDQALDYLELALPDEIGTLLTRSHGVAVRPFGYVQAEEPLTRARERGVEHLVSGRYYREDGDRLSLAIEVQHVRQERVIWQTRITVPSGDLRSMRGRIAEGVRDGLLPALGAQPLPTTGSAPIHDEAYQLYLRSLALPQQPNATQRAIELLERAVTLEPGFAPAWQALGIRYYAYGTWFAAVESARAQSLAAHRKALELDPGYVAAAQSIVTHRTEAGDLAEAFREAHRLHQHAGPSAETHFALSYVYRYGGMLDEAQRHCELALALDPQDPGLRSCAYSYLYAGKLSRVMDFLKLDEDSFFVQWGTVLYHLRRNDREQALHAARRAADEPTRRLMQPCLEGARGTALDAPTREFVEHWQRSGDPEASYALAPMLGFCGRRQEALRFLERAVDGSFCAYPALDRDPAWEGWRSEPEFQRIRAKAHACFDRFRRIVEAGGSPAGADG
jgi:DNA-binding winged helix-turn-helix (wHTH) protein/tetratricopeptide (TPR) repeat protein